MEMRGERLISAPKQETWEALFDPEVLRQCIPGCQSVERLSDTQFKAAVALAIGPVKAKFSGEASMSEIDAPNACKLTGKGNGGVAGFGKGEAWIKLAEQDGGTLLTYDVQASVGGKLAQIGQRLIDSTARKLADDFFGRFVAVIEARKTPTSPAASVTTASIVAQQHKSGQGQARPFILGALVFAMLVGVFYILA